MKKLILCALFSLVSQLIAHAIPDGALHITHQNHQDRILIEKMRPLFFEKKNTGLFDTLFKGLFAANIDEETRMQVQQTATLPPYNGKRVNFVTSDHVRIAGLYFKRDKAPLNIIYINGYFRGLTPTKEWAAPFSIIFPELNILTFDWRGIGESEKVQQPFSCKAYKDICAAVEFIRADNNEPIVLVGFCFGAAMALHATIENNKAGIKPVDALVLSCMPPHMSMMKQRITDPLPVPICTLGRCSVVQNSLLPWLAGDIFELNPLAMLSKISMPIYFEHLTNDLANPLSDVLATYAAAKHPKMLMLSDVGRHVRIHAHVPAQYREALLAFIHDVGIATAKTAKTT